MTLLSIELPMKLPSAGNIHEHWRSRAARVKTQRNAVTFARHGGNFLPAIAATTRGEALVCTLTRISPRKLDSDNLAFAFKAVRDQIAAELGVNDGSDAVRWEYAQESGKAAIRIRIEVTRAEPCVICGGKRTGITRCDACRYAALAAVRP